MENPVPSGRKEDGKHLISTKPNPDKHGIGTRNAFEIIQKYKGEYNISTEQEQFTIQMIFPTEAG